MNIELLARYFSKIMCVITSIHLTQKGPSRGLFWTW